MVRAMEVAVVIPAFNESASIAGVVGRVLGAGHRRCLVVDDGSEDATASEARRAGALVVRHLANRGAGAATRTGLAAALRLGAEAVVTIDADGQHDPAEIAGVLGPVVAGRADLAVGVRRIGRGAMPRMTRLFNGIGNAVTWILSGAWCSDSQSGFRAYGPAALARLELRGNGFEFCSETFREVRRLGLRMVEVPVRAIYFPDGHRKGQNYATGLETVFQLVVRSLMR